MEGVMIDLGGSAHIPFGRFRNKIEVFDIIPGTRQLTIPTGWSRIRVAVVGGGGGGRSVSTTDFHGHGGGGGGGGYAEIELDVVAGQTYTYTVGAGGDLNQDGGTTSFGGLLSATGGQTATNNTTVASKGGAGGIGIGGSINTSGGTGGNGFDASNGGGGGGGASGNRYGDGGAGGEGRAYVDNIVYGGVGGSWANYPKPLLYDDGWGLGITPYDTPLDAGLYVEYQESSNAIYVYYSRVGEGTSDNYNMVNIGGGSCARRNVYGDDVKRGGIGGGGGGGYSFSTGRGGQGVVIVEVLS